VAKKTDLMQGTLDLLILKTLSLGPMHGWGITQRIEQVSRQKLRINPGSLYPSLHRLEIKGWISSELGASEANRRARFYRLTAAGRRRLTVETNDWERITEAVELILKMA
jgi:transcriptional regulator